MTSLGVSSDGMSVLSATSTVSYRLGLLYEYSRSIITGQYRDTGY